MRAWILTRLDPYRLLLFLLIVVYIVIFYGLAADIHAGMRTHKADLGQIDQAVWNSSRGRFVAQTDNGYEATRLTDHVEPILALISPIFWLWDDVRALLFLQVLAVAIGAWILYELALRQFDQILSTKERSQIWHLEPVRALTRPLALALAVAYLLAPHLQSAVLTEFHAAPLAVPLILWAFWAVDTRRWGQFIIAALLVAGVKEEMALLAAGLGAWAIWRSGIGDRGLGRRNPIPSPQSPIPNHRSPLLQSGLSVLLLSLTWFYIATFVIVPTYAAEVYGVAESGYFQRYGALGDSPVDIFTSFFTQPERVWQIASEPVRVDYLLGLLMAFGFLSLLAPELLLLTLPVLLANLLSAYPAQYYGDFHYSAPLIPYFAVAAAYGLGRLWRWLARRSNRSSGNFQQMPASSTGTMAAASLWANSRTAIRPLLTVAIVIWLLGWAGWRYIQVGRGPLGGHYDPPPVTEHHQLLPHFTAQIPADVAVTATAGVHPHLSHRRYIYQFPMGLDAPVTATWALLDVTTNTDMAPGDLKARIDAMLAGEWGVIDAADGFLLLAKGAGTKTIPDAFYDFARVPKQDHVDVASDPLSYVGHEVYDWPRWRQTKLAGIWQMGEGFDPAVHEPQLEIRLPSGEIVTTLNTATPPALVWYPPERWQPGEQVKLTTLPTYLPQTFGLVLQSENNTEATVVGSYRRGADGTLQALPSPIATLDQQAPSEAIFALEDDINLTLEGAVLQETIWPGSVIDVSLSWQGPVTWPAHLAAFVHLRQGEANRAQADGAPRHFLPSTGADEESGVITDWRQLTVPEDANGDSPWQVIIGVYEPASGRRLDLIDVDGNVIEQEVKIAELPLTNPPVADQACALIPATCQSQPSQ